MKNEKDSVHLRRLVVTLLLTIVVTTVMTICNNNNTEVAETNETKEKVETKTVEIAKTQERGTVTSRSSSISREIITIIKEEKEKAKYTAIEDVQISRDMDITVGTGLSKEDFKILISNCKYDTSKFFYDNSDLIYDICKEYELNEIFFCGLISAESGWNIASNHRTTHNYISIMTSGGKLKRYDSLEEGLYAAARLLHNNYLTEGACYYYGKTLEGVHTKFCPSSTWVNLVYGRMKQLL